MNIEPWSSRKSGILAKFTTSEKLSIVTSFLAEGEKVVVKAQSSAVDKVQHRLEQLDSFEEGSQRKLDVSQTEYVSRIDLLNRELVSAWNSGQKVKALRIVIQCAKFLADTEVMRFYPSKFVLVTDILDIFGQLVYDRLRTKADYIKYNFSNFQSCLFSIFICLDLVVKLLLHYRKISHRIWYRNLQKKLVEIGSLKLHQ